VSHDTPTAKKTVAENGKKGAAITNKTGAVTSGDSAEKKTVAENGANGGRGNVGGKSAVAPYDSAFKKTVVDAVSNDIGISKKQVHERINKAAAEATVTTKRVGQLAYPKNLSRRSG